MSESGQAENVGQNLDSGGFSATVHPWPSRPPNTRSLLQAIAWPQAGDWGLV